MILVDTNVLLDVVEDDPDWADWSLQQLQAARLRGRLAINPVIYAELSLNFAAVAALDSAVVGLGLQFRDLPRPALFLAGKAFAKYRRAGGRKANVLADFFVGAHAAVMGWGIITRDARRYRNYFPRVPLVSPTTASR